MRLVSWLQGDLDAMTETFRLGILRAAMEVQPLGGGRHAQPGRQGRGRRDRRRPRVSTSVVGCTGSPSRTPLEPPSIERGRLVPCLHAGRGYVQCDPRPAQRPGGSWTHDKQVRHPAGKVVLAFPPMVRTTANSPVCDEWPAPGADRAGGQPSKSPWTLECHWSSAGDVPAGKVLRSRLVAPRPRGRRSVDDYGVLHVPPLRTSVACFGRCHQAPRSTPLGRGALTRRCLFNGTQSRHPVA